MPMDELEQLVDEALHNVDGEWRSLTPVQRVAEAIRDRLGRHHFMRVIRGGWIVEHSLDCRMADLEECLVQPTDVVLVHQFDDEEGTEQLFMDVPPGRYRVVMFEGVLEMWRQS